MPAAAATSAVGRVSCLGSWPGSLPLHHSWRLANAWTNAIRIHRSHGAFAALVAGTLWCAYGLITPEFAPRYWDVQRGGENSAVALYRVGLLLAVRVSAIHSRQAATFGGLERL